MNGILPHESSQRSDITTMDLDRNLKNLIHERDSSVSQLARATRIPLQTLHNWLSGQKPRDISQVKKVADHFGISVDSLCFGNGTKDKDQDPIKKYDQEIHAGIFEVVLRPIKKTKETR